MKVLLTENIDYILILRDNLIKVSNNNNIELSVFLFTLLKFIVN